MHIFGLLCVIEYPITSNKESDGLNVVHLLNRTTLSFNAASIDYF